MRKLSVATAATVIAVLMPLLASCSSSGKATPVSRSSSASNSSSSNGGVSVNNGPAVSTMQAGKRFTAVANFSGFAACGRPCWLPLYAQPKETPPAATNGWPCEYYEAASSGDGTYCLQPPSGRARDQMGDPTNPNSGDRVLVLCQTTTLANGTPAQTIRNETGQESNVWDRVAIPKAYVKSALLDSLKPVPGMAGFAAAYAPDIWLLNSSWNSHTNQASLGVHNIPCG